MFSTWRPGATPMSQYGLRDERDGDGGQVSEDGGPHRSQKRPQSTSLFPSLDGAASPMPGSMKRLRLSWEQSTSCSAFDAATGFQSQSIEALRGVVEEPSASQAGRGGARFDRETRTAVIEERLYQARTMDACRKSLNNLAETLSRGFQATESSLVVRVGAKQMKVTEYTSLIEPAWCSGAGGGDAGRGHLRVHNAVHPGGFAVRTAGFG